MSNLVIIPSYREATKKVIASMAVPLRGGGGVMCLLLRRKKEEDFLFFIY